jgi:hypothetical protein
VAAGRDGAEQRHGTWVCTMVLRLAIKELSRVHVALDSVFRTGRGECLAGKRSPQTSFRSAGGHCGPQQPYPLSSRPERTRISHFAVLATCTHADPQSHGTAQEIRRSVEERSAVPPENSWMLLPILVGLHLQPDRRGIPAVMWAGIGRKGVLFRRLGAYSPLPWVSCLMTLLSSSTGPELPHELIIQWV